MSILRTNGIQTIAGKPILNSTGGILQVKSVFDNTQYTFSTGSASQTTYYPIAGLTVTITPTSASSQIYIIASVSCGSTANNYNNFLRLYRGATPIALGQLGSWIGTASASFRAFAGSGTVQCEAQTITYFDSPATTSPTTYQIYCCNSGGSTSPSYINRSAQTDTSWVQTTPSSITVMEISG